MKTSRVGDVLVQSRVLPGLTSPYVSRPADLAGRLTRRPIPEGTAVTADALDAALLIHRGQSVILAARAGGVEVRAPGIALADAAAEQRVRVRNLNSLKVIEGVADTAGCGAGEPMSLVQSWGNCVTPTCPESANFSSDGLKFRNQGPLRGS